VRSEGVGFQEGPMERPRKFAVVRRCRYFPRGFNVIGLSQHRPGAHISFSYRRATPCQLLDQSLDFSEAFAAHGKPFFRRGLSGRPSSHADASGRGVGNRPLSAAYNAWQQVLGPARQRRKSRIPPPRHVSPGHLRGHRPDFLFVPRFQGEKTRFLGRLSR